MIVTKVGEERFFTSTKVLEDPGFLTVSTFSFAKNKITDNKATDNNGENGEEQTISEEYLQFLLTVRKGQKIAVGGFEIKEGETSPPKRYNSGSMILAMENAGQLIEDEELRAQIKGSGIGTSATRAEILNKLVKIEYLNLNHKTQIIDRKSVV